MASQQVQFAETIRAMKVALKRRASDQPEDHSTLHPSTNRGHKHLRSTHSTLPSRLNTTLPLSTYRTPIQHAGYTRPIISHNPLLYDFDGDVVSPTGSDDEDHAEPIVDNPFGEVKLEQLLKPLTAASELQHHPSLSQPYKSQALTRMAEEAGEMLRREREVLWRAKRLLRRFRGDGEWMPCGAFEAAGDEGLVGTADEGDAGRGVGIEREGERPLGMAQEDGDMMEVEESQVVNENGVIADGVEAVDMALQQVLAEAQATANELDQPPTTTEAASEPTQQPSALELPAVDARSTSDANSTPTTTSAPHHAMTTRRAARAASPTSQPLSPAPSSPGDTPTVHPWFLTPPSAQPDRDLGLPATEAEDSRRMLLLYVQKQDHIVRQLSTLHSSLLKAHRLRQTVWRAAKAEGHTKVNARGVRETEMSDGEDWYDPADWGLGASELRVLKDGTLGLEKGREEDVGEGEEEGMGRRVVGRRRRGGVGGRI